MIAVGRKEERALPLPDLRGNLDMPRVSVFETAEITWSKLEVPLRKILAADEDATADSVDYMIFKLKPRLLDLTAKSPRVEEGQIVHLMQGVRSEMKLNRAEITWSKLELPLREILSADDDATADSVDYMIFKLKPRLLDLMVKSPRVEDGQIMDLIQGVRSELKLNGDDISWFKLEMPLRKILAADDDATTESVDHMIFKLKPRLLDLMAKSGRVEGPQIMDLIRDVRFELKLNSVMMGSRVAAAHGRGRRA